MDKIVTMLKVFVMFLKTIISYPLQKITKLYHIHVPFCLGSIILHAVRTQLENLLNASCKNFCIIKSEQSNIIAL